MHKQPGDNRNSLVKRANGQHDVFLCMFSVYGSGVTLATQATLEQLGTRPSFHRVNGCSSRGRCQKIAGAQAAGVAARKDAKP